MNLLFYTGSRLDWDLLISCLAEDSPLLAAALTVFRWLAPAGEREFPEWLWERFQMPLLPRGSLAEIGGRRVALLDTRSWFGPDRHCQKRPGGEPASC